MTSRVPIKSVSTGVPGLDEVLGGGLPEFSFNLIAGGPGCGKTTLAHQITFAVASSERPALYVTVLGEPPLKMLRYQQQFGFFNHAKVPKNVRFVHLGTELVDGGLERVLTSICKEVESSSPGLVVVDSFISVMERSKEPGEMPLQHFVQRLSLRLTSWEATTFLIGEFVAQEAENNPIFTVADGVIWLEQSISRNSSVRKLRVAKMRGRECVPGLHTMKITDSGVRVYPRLANPTPPRTSLVTQKQRRQTGVAGLDEMLGGGIPDGYSVMVVGPSGTGKSMLTTQFILEGMKRKEPGVIAVFEKRPEEYIGTAPHGGDMEKFVEAGMLRMLYLRPLDLSVDETMEEVRDAIRAIGAKRVVIDSLSGFELALAPSFREDFRESLYRMIGALTGLGVAVLMTAELVEGYTELQLSPHGISFLTDGIIIQRYVELDGRLERFMFVAKLRGVAHSTEMRSYEIGADGITVGGNMAAYKGLLTGNPRLADEDAGRS